MIAVALSYHIIQCTKTPATIKSAGAKGFLKHINDKML